MRLVLAFLSLLSCAAAQFGFFDQMFGGGGGGQHDDGHPHQQHQHRQANNPSDASLYRAHYDQCTFACLPPSPYSVLIPIFISFSFALHCDLSVPAHLAESLPPLHTFLPLPRSASPSPQPLTFTHHSIYLPTLGNPISES